MQLNGDFKSAVFLDRDGVVNKAKVIGGLPFAPIKAEDVIIIAGVKQAVELLSFNGLEVVVVTNQPDVAKGIISEKELNYIHQKISRYTGIKHFYSCVHDSNQRCNCRKPRTGLLKNASDDLGIDCSKSFLVGDRWKDIEAGQKMGCKCYFIDNNYLEIRPNPPFSTVLSLYDASIAILEGINGKYSKKS